MSKSKFYICSHCKNIATLVENGGGKLVCCGEKMRELVAGEVEASREKHIPVVSVENGVVRAFVGEAEHPMTAEHLIEWVALETEQGYQVQYLKANDAPVCVFKLADGDKAVGVYAYCNLHGLWFK